MCACVCLLVCVVRVWASARAVVCICVSMSVRVCACCTCIWVLVCSYVESTWFVQCCCEFFKIARIVISSFCAQLVDLKNFAIYWDTPAQPLQFDTIQQMGQQLEQMVMLHL